MKERMNERINFDLLVQGLLRKRWTKIEGRVGGFPSGNDPTLRLHIASWKLLDFSLNENPR